ncbi:MAG: PAS domain-containing protein [Acidobacteriota bacterium]
MSGLWRRPREPWLGSFLRALLHLLTSDRIAQVTTISALVVLIVQQLPEPFSNLSQPAITHPIFGLFTLWALRANASWVQGREERGFWNDLVAAALTGLVASIVLPASFLFKSLSLGILSLFSLVASYGFLLLAVERRPHEQGWWRSSELERQLTLPAILIFVVGLLVYFTVVPVMVSGSLEEGLGPTLQLFAVLALVVAVLAAWQVVAAEDPRWRSIYLLFALAMAVLGFFHVFRAAVFDLQAADPTSFAVWILPPWLLVLSIRIRHGSFPIPRPKTEDYFAVRPPELATRTMLLALGPPLLHFGGIQLGLLDVDVRDPREAWILLWVAGLGSVAAVQSHLLARRVRELADERRRIEQVLAHNEHRLRISAARRTVDRELEAPRELLARAFLAHPEALALVDLDDDTYLEANPRFLELLDARRGEVVGSPVAVFGVVGLAGSARRLRCLVDHLGSVPEIAVTVSDRDETLHDVLATLERLEIEGLNGLHLDLRPDERPSAAARLRGLDATVAWIDDDDFVRWWSSPTVPPDEAVGRRIDELAARDEIASALADPERVWSAPVDARLGSAGGARAGRLLIAPPTAETLPASS